MNPLIIQIEFFSNQKYWLNGHPHWAYLLKSIETYCELPCIIETNNADEKTWIEMQGYSQYSIRNRTEAYAERRIVVRDDYSLLSQSTWNLLLNSPKPVFFKSGKEEIARVEIHAKTSLPIQIQVTEKQEQLNVYDKTERIMAEALIKADIFPIHPIRLISPFVIEKSENTGKPKMLFSAPYQFFPKRVNEMFESNFDITYAFNAPAHQTKELLNETEVWLTGTCPPYFIDKNIFGESPQLKIIASPSTGTNHINVSQAESMGIKICSIKTAGFLQNIHASSEHTFALLLAMVKKIPLVTNRAKQGEWREKEHEFRSIELNGRTIGIIGYGRIGSNLARYCDAYGMKILAFDPYKKITAPYVQQVSNIDELLAKSEIVSINYHLNAETENSFGKKDFEKMQEDSYFLNTARGEIVDELAMIDALEIGKLKAAAVDVISNETNLDKWNHPVIAYARNHDNLIVTPHTAGLTIDSESKAAIEIFNEIQKALNEI